MKKHQIYAGALFYQGIAKKELSLSHTRFFRDIFKPILDVAIQYEKDKTDIIKKLNPENKKDLSEEVTKQIIDELNKLSSEVAEIQKLPVALYEKLEEADIKIKASDLEVLEAITE